MNLKRKRTIQTKVTTVPEVTLGVFFWAFFELQYLSLGKCEKDSISVENWNNAHTIYIFLLFLKAFFRYNIFKTCRVWEASFIPFCSIFYALSNSFWVKSIGKQILKMFKEMWFATIPPKRFCYTAKSNFQSAFKITVIQSM